MRKRKLLVYGKRLFCLILTIALITGMLPTEALAVEDESVENSAESENYFYEDGTSLESDTIAEDIQIMGEITGKRESNVKHFRMSDGSISAAVYPYDVHYEDEQGVLEDIDNTLEEEDDESDKVLSNKKNETFVKFMKKGNPNKLYTIVQGKNQIKVSIEGVSKAEAEVEHSEEQNVSGNPYVLQNLSSRVSYSDILEHTDIEFKLIGKELKENIILKEKVEFNELIYNYHLNGSMDVVQKDEKTIVLYEADTENQVMEVTAPVIWDAAGNYYDALKLEVLEEKNSEVQIRLSWELDENAVYPVTLDPTLSFSTNRNQIQDTHIIKGYPSTNYDYNNHIRVRNDGYAMVRFPTPELGSGDKIIKAQLVLTPYGRFDNSLSIYTNENSFNPALYITAHKILRSWEETTATYNNVNPDSGFYDSNAHSYRVVDGDDSYYAWDITRLANEWTEQGVANYGVLLKYDAPPSNGSTFDSFFCSTNGAFTDSSAWPQILYQYINTTGLEDYYSYHTQNLGYAGTGYTNDLTGNLTIVNPVVQTGGSLMPITVSLVYNTDSIDNTATPYGKGWKLNWSQKIDRTIEEDFGYNIAKYIDGDGTEHYFYYESSSGLFIDETDPKRRLIYIDSDNYTLRDSSGSAMRFKRSGTAKEWYLWEVEDAYGNYIRMDLNASNYNRIDRIYSSTGNQVDLAYDQNGYLTGIKYYDGGTQKTVAIGYNNYATQTNNSIGKVTYADGSYVQYHYAHSSLPYSISKVVDVTGRGVAYAYNTQGAMRVNSVQEYGSQGEAGIKLTMQYDAGGTLITDVRNGRTNRYIFAANGTLKSIVDTTADDGNGYGQYYEYNNGNVTTAKGKGNLTLLSKTQKSTVNLMRNHSYENTGYGPTLQAWSETTGTSTGTITTAKSHIGARSYKLTRPSNSNSSRTLGYRYGDVVAGKKYTVSAYVNTAEMVSQGKGASLFIVFPNNKTYESDYVTETKDEWQRISMTFTADQTASVTVCLCIVGATGSVYFDNLQLEEGGLSDYNLLENAGFEEAELSTISGWVTHEDTPDYSSAESQAGTRSGRCISAILQQCFYRQRVSIPNGQAGDTYVASAFAKAPSVPVQGRRYTMLIRFKKNGAAVNEREILFDSNTTEWQKLAGVFQATGAYDQIEFWLLYSYNCNTAYFDNVQLIRDNFGSTYKYDSNGNLTSIVDLQGKSDQTFQYDGNNQLINQTSITGGTITYNYNTTIKQQLDSVSAGGVTTAYTYDSKGNALTSSMYAGTSSSGTRVTSSATYSSNGEYMTSLTDSRGNTTQYTYNETRGYLDTVTTPDNTVTDYSYNSGELLSNVAVTGSNASASVAYNYDSGKRLAAIVSPGNTTYGFTYDNFDRNTAVKIGSRTLSQYYYDSKFRLGSVAYGNGTSISYGYDDLDRQTQVKINDTLRYEYQYDGTSRISQILDVQAGRKILYEYDLLDRVTQEKLYDTSGKKVLSSLKLRYDDSKNRISGYDVDIQGIVKNTDYVYSTNSATPDLISGVKLNGSQKLTYSYDSLNRPVTRTLLTTTPYVTNYTYLEGNGTGKTTGMIKSVKNGSDTLSYAYDEMGNILSVSKNGSLVESYAYDSLGQLKSVTRGTDTYSYAYDNGGNLLSVNKNGTVIKTYAYGNSEWKDLLTSFNGQAITYDTIGNPLTYCGMTMTWSDGRNLAAISSGTDSISYTYDVGNLRTSKTVNGVKTEYYWLDGSLQGQKTGSEYLLFQYDENGKAYGFIVKNGTQETVYYYEFNVQGDIIGIINSAGTKVAEYSYNAWGELISITGSQASTIGQKNPLRYRGYYYDAESGFYYVSSRYYDPEVGRFISADTTDILGVSSDLYDKNLYAYCDNNPVVRVDYSGQIWIYATLGGGIAGGLIGALSYTASSIMNEEKITVGGFVGATLIGIANGAIGGGAGTITTIGIKLMLSFTTGLISGIYTKYTASGTDEQQREAAMSAMITTSVGTFLGTTFYTNGLSKTATVVANYFTTISASTPTEIINVVTQKHLRNRPKLINSRKTAMLSKKYNLPERARPNGYVSCLNL